MKKITLLLCFLLFLISCNHEKVKSETVLEEKLAEYHRILKKYGMEEEIERTLASLNERELKELIELNLKKVEAFYKNQSERQYPEIEKMRAVYTKFVKANSNKERKKVIMEHCNTFTDCDILDLVFEVSPYIYSEEPAKRLNRFLVETKNMNIRQIHDWNLKNGGSHN